MVTVLNLLNNQSLKRLNKYKELNVWPAVLREWGWTSSTTTIIIIQFGNKPRTIVTLFKF